MPQLQLLLTIIVVGFLVNFPWELLHSTLYKIKLPKEKTIPFLAKMALKDGIWIALLYGITSKIFSNTNITQNPAQLLTFILLALALSFAIEKISLKLNRWQYHKTMPLIFGVGATPLLEIPLTGIVTFLIVF